MKAPLSLWKSERASSSLAVDMSAGAAVESASFPTISAAASPAGRGHRRRGVVPGVGVLEDLAAGRQHQCVDPHHVALVAAALHADPLALGHGGVDHVVPGEVGGGRVDAGRLGHRLAVPEQLGVGPERRGDQLVVPEARPTARPSSTPSVSGRHVGRVGDRLQVAGVGELGDEDGVEAHEVDRGVAGGQAAHQLLPLGVGVVGQDLGGDPVGAARLGSVHFSASVVWPPLSGFVYQVSVGVPELSPPHPLRAIGSPMAMANGIAQRLSILRRPDIAAPSRDLRQCCSPVIPPGPPGRGITSSTFYTRSVARCAVDGQMVLNRRRAGPRGALRR